MFKEIGRMIVAVGAIQFGTAVTGASRRARIAMTRPPFLNGNYLFELIDVDGPRPGSLLAQAEVGSIKTSAGAQSAHPISRDVAKARAELRAIGEQRGYTVTDF